MLRKVTDTIYYVGANDHEVDLFEGQYVVPNGMAYNSYVILDEKVAVMDTIDASKTAEWLKNIEKALAGRQPDYLVVQHMEPDHAASVEAFVNTYPAVTVVANVKTFAMIGQFFPNLTIRNILQVENFGTLSLGKHTLTFAFAPMVHWPEVMMTYDSYDKVLFSADGFGKFGALDVDEPWDDEARRYFIGIVGKYGKQVQNILKVAATLDIQIICPLHGPVLTENLGHYIRLYDLWSSYTPEEEGIVIAYTSIYGHTKEAVLLLERELKKREVPNVVVYDLARCDMAAAVSDAFRYDKLVLATTTYNSDVFPFMRTYLDKLTERAFQNRTIAMIENGSWAPTAIRVIKEKLAKSKKITYAENNVTILSALNEETVKKIGHLADELAASYATVQVQDDFIDPTALFNIGYGLYVVTSNDGSKDNGLIVNTVTQVTNTPNRVAVTINKLNYSCDVIAKTGKLNISTLSQEAPFAIFERFGFHSGRDVDKFAGFEYVQRSSNDLLFLDKYANAYISCKVINQVDLDTHVMFICDVTQCVNLNKVETMSYTYYLQNVKPKPEADKKGYVCKICGWVYEGEELPEDIVCPLCKHGAADFEPLS
ncbi:MAG: flavin reductase [Oscillospiraceae bacterium]|nr:flavin reductase [Oscillospiraceae bacterium]